MPLNRPAQGAAGQHTEGEHAHPFLGGAIDQQFVILKGKARRRRLSRCRVEQVVGELDGLESAIPRHCLQQDVGLAQTVHAPMADFALLLQRTEGSYDLR